ncbi:MAG: YdcF family protein [Chitinophagales bacterium]|nr:YdcF family protein [Chitinophagales bacterium]
MKRKKLLFATLIILLVWVVTHISYTLIDGLISYKEKADLAVVLGSKVNEDGTLSKRLTQRLECVLALYKDKQVNHIMVSGGFGKEGFYEGDKMKTFLIAHHVPDSIIIVDNQGNNTLATVDNSLIIQDSLKATSILVVSQYFHLTRTKMLYHKRGFHQVYSASPYYFEVRDIYSLFREFVAFYTSWVGH